MHRRPSLTPSVRWSNVSLEIANSMASLNLGLRVSVLKSLSSLERPFQGYTVGVFEVAAHRYAVGYPRYTHRAVF